MSTTQIVITTLLATAGVSTFICWYVRLLNLSAENLWIEPVILIVIALFGYLVVVS